jgi:hypothetical protein
MERDRPAPRNPAGGAPVPGPPPFSGRSARCGPPPCASPRRAGKDARERIAAISGLVFPSATQARTSVSRRVSPWASSARREICRGCSSRTRRLRPATETAAPPAAPPGPGRRGAPAGAAVRTQDDQAAAESIHTGSSSARPRRSSVAPVHVDHDHQGLAGRQRDGRLMLEVESPEELLVGAVGVPLGRKTWKLRRAVRHLLWRLRRGPRY